MKNAILIIGSIITLILAILWYLEKISEPLFAVATAIMTLLTYLFFPEKENASITQVKQKHTGNGDNVAGNKITKH